MSAVVIAVVGTGADDADSDLLTAAEAVGVGIAEAGAVIVCGGLGGVMAAASRGARRVGGTVVGLLPGTDRAAANPFLTLAIATGLGEGRNLLVARAADAMIAVGGEYGTLSEIGFGLKIGTPVVGLRTWELRRDGQVDDGIVTVADAAEAVAAALAAAGRPRAG